MQLFYYPELNPTSFAFSEEESKHCIKVLRHQKGDRLWLIDGKGNKAEAVITDAHPKRCSGEIIRLEHHEPRKSYQLTLSIAPTKQHERMDWLVEKATEIGIDEINFIACKNGERPKINLERLQKIAISSIKQSKQYYLPSIGELRSLEQCLSSDPQVQKFMAWCPSPETTHLSKLIKPEISRIHILIGPEGDFTAEEVNLAQKKGYTATSLGSNILRTETAALTTVAITMSLFSRIKA